jgi:hypothetical protein
LTAAEFQSDRSAPRPVIRVVPGQLPEVVNTAEQALLQANLGIYRRGTVLVRVGSVPVTVGQEREFSTQRMLEVEDHALVEAMTQAAQWESYDKRSKRWVAIDAPLKVAATYRQRIGRWNLPILAGLLNAPTLRPNGSLLASPGYDAKTGLLLDVCGGRFPAIPDQPTKQNANQALAVLTDLIATFPFRDDASRSVALSAILTASIRRSLMTAPLHAFTAPVAGSGKSMLVDLASVIATGREAGVIAQGKEEQELEKRLGALLLAGVPVIAIDNCESPLGGEFLCSMLTQLSVRLRILGRSEVPELPANALVTATGNNLVLLGDLTRRALLCRLDPNHERPELRQFVDNPLAVVGADRGRYLTAALIILRAYHLAGRPNKPAAFGSFEDWSSWVRGALIWLGCDDPVATMEEARELDPRLDQLIAVVAQWRSVVGLRSVSVRELIETAIRQRPAPGMYGLEFENPDLREAFLAVAGEGGAINSRRLGKWILAHQHRIAEGMRLVRHGLIKGVLHWRLEPTNGLSTAATD